MGSTKFFAGLPEDGRPSISRHPSEKELSSKKIGDLKDNKPSTSESSETSDKRVPNAPRGCISEIFSGDQADGVVAAALRNGSNGKPRLVRDTPVKPRDTHSRLFGGQVASPVPAPQVTDTIRSNIKFEEGVMMNGKGAAVNGNGVASPAKSPVANGVSAMNGSAGSSAVSTPSKGEYEHLSYQPPRRNPVTGDGVFLPPRPRRWATARARGAADLEPQPLHHYLTTPPELQTRPPYAPASALRPRHDRQVNAYNLLGLKTLVDIEKPSEFKYKPIRHFDLSEDALPDADIFTGVRYKPVKSLDGPIDPYLISEMRPYPTMYKYEVDGPIPDYIPIQTPVVPGPRTVFGFPPIIGKHTPGYLYKRHRYEDHSDAYFLNYARAREMEGNPITGDGYKSLNGEINTAVTALNGNFMPINHNRIPPGGYSTGLW